MSTPEGLVVQHQTPRQAPVVQDVVLLNLFCMLKSETTPMNMLEQNTTEPQKY